MGLQSIEDVLEALDRVVERAWNEQSRLGYFAALYRRVTRRVREGIANGEFQDAARMEKLDVLFAGRYLDALTAYRAGRAVSQCWQVAFDGAEASEPLVLQHLLAGMNAHINYDLGLACAACCPGAELAGLEPDFDQINNLLATQVGAVEQELCQIAPALRLLEKCGMRTATRFINFDMKMARDFAWRTARTVNLAPPEARATVCGGLDATVAELGKAVLHPPLLTRTALLPVRLEEPGDVRKILSALGAVPSLSATT
ncbi:MAG TPA: DUF5995 family protein [Terriglobales bacterium]|nr:DUF5995 family protein [Terriglobales bacterium]